MRGETVAPFEYFDKGSSGGHRTRAERVAQFGSSLRFSGLLAWLLWLFVHLMYLVTFQNRVLVFMRWGSSTSTYNRGARLITGEPESGAALKCQRRLYQHAEVRSA